MNIWLNGTFGVGKTTTSAQLAAITGRRVFDPEHVGYMLQASLSDLMRDNGLTDFQQLDAWRSLVPQVARSVVDATGAELILVQSVLVEEYWHELRAGMDAAGLPVFHVVLEADDATMRERIENDELEAGAREWRLGHLAEFQAARPWMVANADLVLNTTDLSVAQAAKAIATVLA
jgi:shikimate kinase